VAEAETEPSEAGPDPKDTFGEPEDSEPAPAAESDLVEVEVVDVAIAESADGETAIVEMTVVEVATVPIAESDVDTAAHILADARVADLRERMLAAQAQFTQAAIEAVAQAEVVVTDAITEVNQALAAETAAAGAWRESEQPEAGALDQALARYRGLLDRMLSL